MWEPTNEEINRMKDNAMDRSVKQLGKFKVQIEHTSPCEECPFAGMIPGSPEKTARMARFVTENESHVCHTRAGENTELAAQKVIKKQPLAMCVGHAYAMTAIGKVSANPTVLKFQDEHPVSEVSIFIASPHNP